MLSLALSEGFKIYLQIGGKDGLGGKGSRHQTWGLKFHPQNPQK